MTDRKKTTVQLPWQLSRQVEDWGRRLGTGKNGFLTMGAAMLLADLAKIETRQKRLKMLRDVEAIFQRALAEARDTA